MMVPAGRIAVMSCMQIIFQSMAFPPRLEGKRAVWSIGSHLVGAGIVRLSLLLVEVIEHSLECPSDLSIFERLGDFFDSGPFLGRIFFPELEYWAFFRFLDPAVGVT